MQSLSISLTESTSTLQQGDYVWYPTQECGSVVFVRIADIHGQGSQCIKFTLECACVHGMHIHTWQDTEVTFQQLAHAHNSVKDNPGRIYDISRDIFCQAVVRIVKVFMLHLTTQAEVESVNSGCGMDEITSTSPTLTQAMDLSEVIMDCFYMAIIGAGDDDFACEFAMQLREIFAGYVDHVECRDDFVVTAGTAFYELLKKIREGRMSEQDWADCCDDLTERVKKELNKDNPCTQALHAVRREQQVYHGAAMAARWRAQKRAASKEGMAKKRRNTNELNWFGKSEVKNPEEIKMVE